MSARPARNRSSAEWVTLALSLVVVGGLIAIALMAEASRDQEAGTRVDITFDRDRVAQRADSYYVPYAVRNTGSTAISSAEIWIEVYAGDRMVESAEVIIQFLPLQGTQEGVYVTTRDPRMHTLRGRLESLQFP